LQRRPVLYHKHLYLFANLYVRDTDNLYPTFSALLGREKERGLRQRRRYLAYGLSAPARHAGERVERRLHADGFTTQLLDGDNVARAEPGSGFTDADRAENIRRIAEVRSFCSGRGDHDQCFITPSGAARSGATDHRAMI